MDSPHSPFFCFFQSGAHRRTRILVVVLMRFRLVARMVVVMGAVLSGVIMIVHMGPGTVMVRVEMLM